MNNELITIKKSALISTHFVQDTILSTESLIVSFWCTPMTFFFRIVCIHTDHHMLIILLVLLGITMQTLSLVATLLPPLRLRIKLLFLGIRFQIHPKIIKFLRPRKVLRLFLFFLEKLIRSILTMHKYFLFFDFIFFVFDCTTQMFFMFLLRMNTNIVIVKINKRSFLLRTKKVIFSIIIHSFKWLHCRIVKRW